jgi:hypothetical protein
MCVLSIPHKRQWKDTHQGRSVVLLKAQTVSLKLTMTMRMTMTMRLLLLMLLLLLLLWMLLLPLLLLLLLLLTTPVDLRSVQGRHGDLTATGAPEALVPPMSAFVFLPGSLPTTKRDYLGIVRGVGF